MEEECVLKEISSSTTPVPLDLRPRSRLGIFSLFVLGTVLYGVWTWYGAVEEYKKTHGVIEWDHYRLKKIMEPTNEHSFEETVLKYRIYLTVTVGFVEPNIILAICILLTFPILLSIVLFH
jgi:hypothetical protein